MMQQIEKKFPKCNKRFALGVGYVGNHNRYFVSTVFTECCPHVMMIASHDFCEDVAADIFSIK
jgi:hypothetical protein